MGDEAAVLVATRPMVIVAMKELIIISCFIDERIWSPLLGGDVHLCRSCYGPRDQTSIRVRDASGQRGAFVLVH